MKKDYLMNQVWITDAAVVTSVGSGINETWKNIISGKSGIKKLNLFKSNNYVSDVAACIDFLDHPCDDSFLKIMTSHLLSHLDKVPENTLLMTATTKSCIDDLERFQRRKSHIPPMDAAGFSMPLFVSNTLGLKDKGINISAACASSTIAIAKGASAISSGAADAVLVCCMDMVSEFVFAGFSSIGAMSPSPARPFDKNRSGLTLGEGAAALLMMSPARAVKENMRPLAGICGWGFACDAAHITAPARDGAGLFHAVKGAFDIAGIKSDQIGAISAHGTGTIYNDAMEMTAFKNFFPRSIPPVNSIKGSIGHTLGAGGGIEAALGIYMLKNQMLPPTVGLEDCEDEFQDIASNTLKKFSGDYLLTTNSGFGGINAALILAVKEILVP